MGSDGSGWINVELGQDHHIMLLEARSLVIEYSIVFILYLELVDTYAHK